MNREADAGAQALLRRIPSVDEVLQAPEGQEECAVFGRGVFLFHLRALLDELRVRIRANGRRLEEDDLAPGVIAYAVRWRAATQDPLPEIINGTGVILHSGLGRAPLAEDAVGAVSHAGRYALLEVDRARGEREARDTRIGALLRTLTGAEASLTVNNNAAATLLILNTLAQGREVICSRGEMVEIGGSFRIPDVMQASGCRLVEVGTTNRTHVADYERAITPETAALLVVHTSNYRIMGFTATPPLAEVVALGRARGIPVVHDLGSGSLLGPEELGLGDEPPVSKSLKAGADVVCMSGDKLLGGPQAGIILGRKDPVQRMRNNPLARALRIDKMTVAALEATLALFLEPERLRERHPVIRMLTAPVSELEERARALAASIGEALASHRVSEGVDIRVQPSTAEAGSGALPTLQIPSVAVALRVEGVPADALARMLREHPVAVFTRIADDRVCIDLRTLFPGQERHVAGTIAHLLGCHLHHPDASSKLARFGRIAKLLREPLPRTP